MYGAIRQSGRSTRLVGLITAGLMTVGAGYVFTYGMIRNYIAPEKARMELVMLAPEKLQEVKPLPKEEKIEVEKPRPAELFSPPDPVVVPDVPVIVAPPAPAIPAPAPIGAVAGSDRIPPKLRIGAKPPYPAASIRALEQGRTHLEVCVSQAGRVTSASVARSSGFPRLDDAALKWIRNSRFAPGSVGGIAQSMCGHSVIYEWSLEDMRA